MRVSRLLKTKTLAPVQNARAEDRHLHDRMEIKTLDKRRRIDPCVSPGNACHTRLGAEIKRQVCDRPRGQTYFEGRELSHHDSRLIREKNGVSRKKKIRAGVGLVPADKGQGALHGRRNDIEAIFVNLAEDEGTDQIHVRGATKAAA